VEERSLSQKPVRWKKEHPETTAVAVDLVADTEEEMTEAGTTEEISTDRSAGKSYHHE
jgi:hypothetical protein